MVEWYKISLSLRQSGAAIRFSDDCAAFVFERMPNNPEVSSFLIPQIPVARCFLLQLLFPVRCRSWLNT